MSAGKEHKMEMRKFVKYIDFMNSEQFKHYSLDQLVICSE